jgi:hypothetical protein
VKAGRKPAKGLIEVSTTGGLGQSVMQQSAQSVLDELDVTLGLVMSEVSRDFVRKWLLACTAEAQTA